MEVRRGSVRRGCVTGGAHSHERRKSGIPLWRLFIFHGGVEKFFGTLISFFRTLISFFRTLISFFGTFISFFRSFISALREGFSFSRVLARISSVGSDVRSQESVFLIGREHEWRGGLGLLIGLT